jgi:pyridoxamine 5'-phosphate oxidase
MITHPSIAAIRKVYQLQSLSENEVDRDPLLQFQSWWSQALESKVEEPNAMALATCNAQGRPSARIVLLKGIHENGLVFFTNYESRKAKEIAENSFVSLLFFWKELERQVRVEGSINKISTEDSDAYFSERPHESQVGAWSSPQSQVIDNRHILEENVRKYNEKYEGLAVPRPGFWGGYLVAPERIEFWQGRPGRLHDRLLYTISDNNQWKLERLAP